MQIAFTKWGKIGSDVRALGENYAQRIQCYLPCSLVILKDRQKIEKTAKEARWIWVALDEDGKQFSSTELAQQIQTWKDDPGVGGIRFLIGGPYGLNAQIRSLCKQKWSLSKGTLPSELAWMVAIEQVYRSLSILAHSPYHHG